MKSLVCFVNNVHEKEATSVTGAFPADSRMHRRPCPWNHSDPA